MSRQERLMLKGLIAEKKQRISELDFEMASLGAAIRDELPLFLDAEHWRTRIVLDSAQRLHNCRTEYDRLKAELGELKKKEWDE